MGTPLSDNYWIAKLQLLLLRIFGGSVKLVLDMPQESFARFARIRSMLANLRRKPTSYNDVGIGAIDAYYTAVMAAEAGATFIKVDAEGNRTPIELFETT